MLCSMAVKEYGGQTPAHHLRVFATYWRVPFFSFS